MTVKDFDFASMKEIFLAAVTDIGLKVLVTLNILLVVGILGYFGIQTTSFAALIATAGIAIGAAWA